MDVEDVSVKAEQEPAAVPRELTPRVRRRTWTEPRVRLWWILALAVLVLTIFAFASQAAAWWSERQLLKNGVEVHAVVTRALDEMNDIRVPDKKMPPNSECELEFDWNGQKKSVFGRLPEHVELGQHVYTGPAHPVTLRVDPNDPEHWTDRTVSPPFATRQLIGVAVGTPIVLVLALLATAARRRAADVWKNGDAAAALVVGTGQTAIAPGARTVKCTPADSHDSRVFTVYLPRGAGNVQHGDVVWVVHPRGKTEPLYAAAWFDRP